MKILAPGGNPTDRMVGDVLVEPGCRNYWHSHPHGQLLVVTAGTGYYQEKGQFAQRLHPGDTVVIAPTWCTGTEPRLLIGSRTWLSTRAPARERRCGWNPSWTKNSSWPRLGSNH